MFRMGLYSNTSVKLNCLQPLAFLKLVRDINFVAPYITDSIVKLCNQNITYKMSSTRNTA